MYADLWERHSEYLKMTWWKRLALAFVGSISFMGDDGYTYKIKPFLGKNYITSIERLK